MKQVIIGSRQCRSKRSKRL